MSRVLSGVQPSGAPTLGNYLGAFRHWVSDQHVHDSFFCVVDLHALTVEHDPSQLRSHTLDTATTLLAAGIDPDTATLFVQSQVGEHAELAWILECTATVGELRRMTQFKEKSATATTVRAGLLTYPVLMAADILLYDADRVPVGDDQRQHLELARDLALRFNSLYGPTLVVPEASVPPAGARIMDLQEPTRKMSKSVDSPQGTILVLDDPRDIERKIRRAVTDTDGEVRYDPASKPGVSNLLDILAACRGQTPTAVAEHFDRYGALKDEVAEAVAETLRPLREAHAKLSAHPDDVMAVLEEGARKAESIASATLARVGQSVGLLPRLSRRRLP
jgi:tryptophanyl-tRNA synthetase